MRMLLGFTAALALLASGGEAFADKGKWGKEHLGDIKFVIGYEKGAAEAKFSGRPMMLFFTATW